MKKIYFLILVLAFPFTVNASTWDNLKINNLNSFNEFKEYKTLLNEENLNYKNNLETTYNKYVDILKIMRDDLIWFYWIMWAFSLILVSWIGYFLKQITIKKIDTIVENSIREELENKQKDINNELSNFFENAKLWVKSKKIYYIQLWNESEEHFLKQQWFNNIEINNNINISNLDWKDLVIIDARTLHLTNNTNETIENEIRKVKWHNTELIVLLYILWRYEWEKTDYFTFANNRITLVNQTIDCLNLNISSTNRTINNS